MKNSYQSNVAFFPSLILSIVFYFLVIFAVFYHVQMKDVFKKYTSQKNNFLEVSIVEREKKPSITEQPKLPTKQKKEKLEKKSHKIEQKDALAHSKKESVALKDLFGKIETKKAKAKPIPNSSKDPSKTSRLKKQKAKSKKQKNASSITKSLKLKTSSTASGSSNGEYNKFLGEVQEILDGYWNQTIETTSGASAKVKVSISSEGKFSYTIVSLSYNDDFNIKLRRFLELMKDVQFPRNKENRGLGIINFKDLSQENP